MLRVRCDPAHQDAGGPSEVGQSGHWACPQKLGAGLAHARTLRGGSGDPPHKVEEESGMKIDSLSGSRKHVVLLYSAACLVRKTRSDRLRRNPIFVLLRTLARRIGLLIVRRAARLFAAPEPADLALVRLGPGGDFTRYWPERPPQKRIVQWHERRQRAAWSAKGVSNPWPPWPRKQQPKSATISMPL